MLGFEPAAKKTRWHWRSPRAMPGILPVLHKIVPRYREGGLDVRLGLSRFSGHPKACLSVHP